MSASPGGTPNDAPAALPLALLAAGRPEEASEALRAARQWPIHVFECTFEALPTLASALLDGRTEQVILAVEALRVPEPSYRAGTLVAAAEVVGEPTGLPWLREALDQFTWAGTKPPPESDGCARRRRSGTSHPSVGHGSPLRVLGVTPERSTRSSSSPRA